MTSVFRTRLARYFRAFRRAEHGNVAIMFAIAIVPIIGLVGAAVDYSRANSARSALQAALDATALMISREAAGLSEEEIRQRAQAYFESLYNHSDASISPLDVHYTPNSGNGASVSISTSGSIQTAFMKAAGFPTIGFGSSTSTKWGAARLRVAMALDNTLSMASSSKMDNLKTAAADLLTTLQNSATADGDVYVSVIPFNVMVKVDPSNVTADWIDWTAWEAEPPFNKPGNWSSIGPGSSCPFTSRDHGFTCTDRPATASGARSASSIPSSGTYAGYICPSVDGGNKTGIRRGIFYNGCYNSVPTETTTTQTVNNCNGKSNCTCTTTGRGRNQTTVCTQTVTTTGAPYTHNWIVNDRSTWNGCIADRNKDYDTNADAPIDSATSFPAMQYKDCPVTLMQLSYDWESLASKIEAMQPVGYTNQSIGMAWGWLSLLQQKPLNAPALEANYQYTNVVILLSDGDNTQNRFSTSASAIDARQKLLCDNAKALNPQTGRPHVDEIFTIQVNTDGTATSSVMEYCASNPKAKHAFTTTTAAGIGAAFNQIATQLSMLRLTQ